MPDGLLAVPFNGKGRGVLILHAWWGLNQDIKNLCARLAAEGYVAYAPDLFDGQVATTIEQAEQQARNADGEHTVQKVRAALKTLVAQAGVNNDEIAVIGFSFGAYYALQLSCLEPESIRTVVIFYGTGDGDFKQSRARYLGHFAENDPYELTENVDWLENELKSAGRSLEIYRYPNVGHWFFEPSRVDTYDKEAAELAWTRTLAFLPRTSTRTT